MTGPTDFAGLLRRLIEGGVQFILVGGLAGNVHGSATATSDIDIVYGRDPQTLERLVRVLDPLAPYPRGAPAGLPFVFDVDTLRHGLNFTLTTSAGDLDLLGEVIGGGSYEALLPFSEAVPIFGASCRCVTLPTLLRLKRAAGRPRDLNAIAELEALLEERGPGSGNV